MAPEEDGALIAPHGGGIFGHAAAISRVGGEHRFALIPEDLAGGGGGEGFEAGRDSGRIDALAMSGGAEIETLFDVAAAQMQSVGAGRDGHGFEGLVGAEGAALSGEDR